MTEETNFETRYVHLLTMSALHCRVMQRGGDDTLPWKEAILGYAGNALALSSWGTAPLSHIFQAIRYVGVEMYGAAASEFEFAAAAAKIEPLPDKFRYWEGYEDSWSATDDDETY